MKAFKWWIYTVGLGLLPILMKTLLYFLMNNANASLLFDSADVYFFCVVLGINNVNELEHFHRDDTWKSKINGSSHLFVVVSSVLYALSLVDQNTNGALFNSKMFMIIAVFIAVGSLLFGMAVNQKLKSYEQT